ncbi:MAG: SAF domain-containing protein [Myxococcaceae bacterium]|nr:SAF domain-containing protein [Myxococcaceae bacterium]
MTESRGASVALGVLSGLVVACLAGGAVGGVLYRRAKQAATDRDEAAWAMTRTVVAAVNLSPGTPITIDLLSDRKVPSRLVTSSAVPLTEASSLIGQPLRVAVSAGDVLPWTAFDQRHVDPSCVTFATSLATSIHAHREAPITKLLGALEQRAGADAGGW